MTKVKHLFAALLILTTCGAYAQAYKVYYTSESADSTFLHQKLALKKNFTSEPDAHAYINSIPALLQSKGYIAASVDSVSFDSAGAHVLLYLGILYQWSRIQTMPDDLSLLEAVRWPPLYSPVPMDFPTLNKYQQNILDYLEEHGHPFGKVYLDSIALAGNEVQALLRIDRGPLYRIDSIRIFGEAKVSNEFIQRYLGITNGSPYNRKKLENITRRITELSFLQEERPSDITLLGSGSVLNIYLKPRKSSQVYALVGILPNSDLLRGNKKVLLTVDANILLRNALGAGETMGLVYQQLQQQSPRLNILFEQPYVFRSPFGLTFTFDMYKKDSIFLNMNMNLGSTYRIEDRQTTTIFLQRRQSFAYVNENIVLQTRKLPPEADVRSTNLGIGYSFINTDFRFNPRKGYDMGITASAGIKKIRPNNEILELEDPSDPAFKFSSLYDTVKLRAYQFRIIAHAARFVPLGGQSTLRIGFNGGFYQSANYFRNELFQIGGFRLLRGFDEESQFVSRYALGSIEYRLRMNLNSYFFVFTDGGWGAHILESGKNHTYIGSGIGLSLDTKAGILNLAWAIGKRDDTEINLRKSKFHVGLASYF